MVPEKSPLSRQSPTPIDQHSEVRFFVVVPAYNEEANIGDTLEGLSRQSDSNFEVLVVDNASTDNTAKVVRAFAESHPSMPICIVEEPEKGTGAACDTGFRKAIGFGADFIARTDADSIPHVDWIKNLKRGLLSDKLEFVAGKVEPRADDYDLTLKDRILLPIFRFIVENYGKIHRRGRKYKYPYFLVVGSNLAITPDLYLRSGGFPRTPLEKQSNDVVLGESVRKLTRLGALRRDAIVYTSIRRLREFGYLKTLLWLWNRRYSSSEPDIRA